MNKKITIAILSLIILIGIFFHVYKFNKVPPCLNADEVAFGYNAYSILKTGKDEYGAFLPARLKSFEDYKLPLYTYASIPIIKLFGLNDFSTRAINVILGISFIPLIFLITRELFKNNKVALLASLLISLNPGVYILTRHAHEGVIATFFILLTLYSLLRYLKTKKTVYFVATNIALLLTAFSYQSGRLYLVFFFILQLIFLIKSSTRLNQISIKKIIFLIAIVLFSLSFDIKYGINRVNNLFFFRNIGFTLRINEYLGEDHNYLNHLLHNKLTEGIRELTNRYFEQLSPQFLMISGDTNWRFGFPNIGLITPIEYLAFFIGLYFLFKRKEQRRYLLLSLFFIAPFANALTWQDPSLIRAYPLLFSLLIIAGYGFYFFLQSLKKSSLLIPAIIISTLVFIFFRVGSLDIYFNHYPQRSVVQRAWQCGYRELVAYVQKNYDRYDRFVVTDRHGQPYIYFLYYLKYDPVTYQKQAHISTPDQYGFGQVAHFDKFYFGFKYDKNAKKTVYIGYPDQFADITANLDKVKKIKIGPEVIFWIYEVN